MRAPPFPSRFASKSPGRESRTRGDKSLWPRVATPSYPAGPRWPEWPHRQEPTGEGKAWRGTGGDRRPRRGRLRAARGEGEGPGDGRGGLGGVVGADWPPAGGPERLRPHAAGGRGADPVMEPPANGRARAEVLPERPEGIS